MPALSLRGTGRNYPAGNAASLRSAAARRRAPPAGRHRLGQAQERWAPRSSLPAAMPAAVLSLTRPNNCWHTFYAPRRTHSAVHVERRHAAGARHLLGPRPLAQPRRPRGGWYGLRARVHHGQPLHGAIALRFLLAFASAFSSRLTQTHRLPFKHSLFTHFGGQPSRTAFLTSRRPDTTKNYVIGAEYWRTTGGSNATSWRVGKVYDLSEYIYRCKIRCSVWSCGR